MVSIIIPAHNEDKNLKKILGYLVSIVDKRTEIVVGLSSASPVYSADLPMGPSIRMLCCKGKGRALQMNQAVTESHGDILVFLHADVIPPASFLCDIEKAMDDGYDAGFFSYRFDKENFLLKINASFTSKDGIFTGGGDQCLFIKRSIFKALGGFNEAQVVMEDFEFFKRMKKKRLRYTIIKNDLIVSARKYQHNSYVRVNLSNLLLVFLFKMGYPSTKLKVLHDRLIRTPYQKTT